MIPPPAILGNIMWISELALALRKRSGKGAVSKDRHSLQIIWIVYLASIGCGIAAAYRLPECRLPGPQYFLWAGYGLFVLGTALRWYAIIYLGRFFTANVAIAGDHRVIDTGPYRFIRHPSYTGGLTAILGLGLSFQNWASLLIVFIPCLAVMLWRIHLEEKVLSEGLGEAYVIYMRRTKRLIPFIY